MKRKYLLVGANFFAAIGGGIVLVAVQRSIVSFFIGAAIGFVFSQLAPKRYIRPIARWFSLIAALISVLLYVIVRSKGQNTSPDFLFFALLSIRFGLWFFVRALRAQTVGNENQGVALIELGYYSGAALGLFGWRKLGFESWLLTSLLVDALIQSVAGVIDLLVIRNQSSNEQTDAGSSSVLKNAKAAKFDNTLYWKLTIAVVCLTIGFQAVWFSIAESNESFKGYILACFYLGVGLSALVCKSLKIKFDWQSLKRRFGHAVLASDSEKFRPKPFGVITMGAALSMTIALVTLGWSEGSISVLILTALSAFSYQILVLSLLDRIGREERSAELKEKIKQTYLVAALATIGAILVLKSLTPSYLSHWILTTVCCVIAFSAVRKHSAAKA